ncbi:MAG: hypothetical protein JRI45_09200 [Deltaproteobacteria bacterium]|nr:hypothetical protein [Deltaproteobacteria bacterium]MBW2067637.1 hypothetical protein [Deltaproteobacteria bacterium]
MEDWKVRESAFIGKLTAGATHELRNVLAIIGESAGLVEDILQFKGAYEKFSSKFVLIKEQISRGQAILSALNRYAHSTDFPIQSLDVRQSLQDMAVLSQRFLRQKKRECFLTQVDPIIIKTYAVKWNMVHFAVLMSLADDIDATEPIEIRCFGEDSGVAVIFCPNGSPRSEYPTLRALLEDASFRKTMALIEAEADIGKDVAIRTREIKE